MTLAILRLRHGPAADGAMPGAYGVHLHLGAVALPVFRHPLREQEIA